MVTIYNQIHHNSGIPLGGIGTGSVEIRPDGLFHDWEIFNNGPWNAGSSCFDRNRVPMRPGELRFLVRTKTPDGETVVRYLALKEELHNLYSLAWARCVEAIEFDGTFPVAVLHYIDSALPVQIQAEIFSPFISLDPRSSGTPGFYVHFNLRNLTDVPVEVSILGVMRNAAGYDQESRRPHNTLHEIGEAKAVRLGAEGLEDGACSSGDLTFAAEGGEISYIQGAYSEDHLAMVFYKSRYGRKTSSYLHQFRDDGRLPNLQAHRPLKYAAGLTSGKITEQHRKELLQELIDYPAFYDKYHRMKLVDPELADSPEFLDELLDNVKELVDRKMEFGWAALCSSRQLEPEAEGEALFNVGWYFPNHVSGSGRNIGHKYQEWFDSSLDVSRFMLENYSDLRERTLALPSAIHNSSLPEEAAEAVTSQLSTLTKCTWWTKAGQFGVWEGLGCCGFHTTDITYQGSFPIISLFPDLQKTQMEHGAGFQREDGRVHHFFTPDFGSVDNGFDRVDMNQQFVMLAARDYLWTGDRDYIQRLWPHIIRAMDNTALLDTDGDGLPDTDTRRNTYDCWDFQGCPSYISSLWLGALKAAVRLADEMGDSERAGKWQETYDRGLRSLEDKLWNGEYYVLWRDGDQIDECCMSDQMSGDWFAAASGWDPILNPDRTAHALDAIVRYNFQDGEGLLNAVYPPGKPRRIAASDNFQAEAPWTGIEYTVAALLISNGMVADGMAIVRDIHNRYLQAGRVWNHVECGGHYYRAMSSWTVMNVLSGFKWDQPRRELAFAPAIDQPSSEYPFFTPAGWGIYRQRTGLSGTRVEIEIMDGQTTVSTLSVPAVGDSAEVVVEGETVGKAALEDGRLVIRFPQPVTLTKCRGLAIAAP